MAVSDLHQAALDYAAAGMPVFPCHQDSKQPACANGFKDATVDTDQIDAWWTENPDYNVAFEPGSVGLCAVDIDPPDGAANWQALLDQHDTAITTWTVQSPRGGFHHYFQGELPPTVGRLAPHIDTRGRGSYVLLPPSRTPDGVYEAIDTSPVAELPGWIGARLARSQTAAVKEAPEGFEADTPALLQKARGIIANHRGAVDGSRDDTAYKLANRLKDLGLSHDAALELMQAWNTDKVVPPQEEGEVEHVVQSAYAYGQNAIGARVEEAVTDWSKQAASLGPPPAVKEKRSRYYPEDEDEQEAGKEPQWLIPDFIPDGVQLVMIYGKTQSFKSFLALDMALCVATGGSFFGRRPLRSGPVFYVALEGRESVKKGRRRAWKAARGVEKVPNFFVMAGPAAADADQTAEFVEQIVNRLDGRQPGMFVIDTVAKAMVGWDENSAKDAGLYTDFVQRLANHFNCPVVSIHHSGKDSERGERGSSAWRANMDSSLEVTAHKELRLAVLHVHKHKDAPEPEEDFYFEGQPFAGSLAFMPIDAQHYKELTDTKSLYDQKIVFQALVKLKAFGIENMKPTRVLASELLPQTEGESAEERDKKLGRMASQLHRLGRAHGPLSGLMHTVARQHFWLVPEPKTAE